MSTHTHTDTHRHTQTHTHRQTHTNRDTRADKDTQTHTRTFAHSQVSKVWTETIFKGPEAVRAQVEKALADLQTDYLDLFLIHWPVPGKHVQVRCMPVFADPSTSAHITVPFSFCSSLHRAHKRPSHHKHTHTHAGVQSAGGAAQGGKAAWDRGEQLHHRRL